MACEYVRIGHREGGAVGGVGEPGRHALYTQGLAGGGEVAIGGHDERELLQAHLSAFGSLDQDQILAASRGSLRKRA